MNINRADMLERIFVLNFNDGNEYWKDLFVVEYMRNKNSKEIQNLIIKTAENLLPEEFVSENNKLPDDIKKEIINSAFNLFFDKIKNNDPFFLSSKIENVFLFVFFNYEFFEAPIETVFKYSNVFIESIKWKKTIEKEIAKDIGYDAQTEYDYLLDLTLIFNEYYDKRPEYFLKKGINRDAGIYSFYSIFYSYLKEDIEKEKYKPLIKNKIDMIKIIEIMETFKNFEEMYEFKTPQKEEPINEKEF